MKHSQQAVMGLASIFSFLMPASMAIDFNCDYFQEMAMGQQYYIYNERYPDSYGPSESCRWEAHSPPNTVILLTCFDLNIPESPSCQGDRLSVSLSGDPNFRDAKNYCGRTGFTNVTQGNALAVGFFSTKNSTGGRFTCSVTAIQPMSSTTTTEKPVRCDCGWRHKTRIVGGYETGVNEFPSMAALIDSTIKEAYCGASIISDRYALTAAHCLNHKEAGNLGLLVGDHNLSTGADTSAASLYRISEFKIHPDYNPETFGNDIAVLQTQDQIKFSMVVGPICLPFRYTLDDFYGQVVTALGWGFTEFGGPKSDTLQEVQLSVISNVQCAAVIPDPVIPSEICTYAPNKDTCTSDSGGPLLWEDVNTSRLQLVGIISFGLGCATSKPAVSTRVTSYLTWITSVTSDTAYCIR